MTEHLYREAKKYMLKFDVLHPNAVVADSRNTLVIAGSESHASRNIWKVFENSEKMAESIQGEKDRIASKPPHALTWTALQKRANTVISLTPGDKALYDAYWKKTSAITIPLDILSQCASAIHSLLQLVCNLAGSLGMMLVAPLYVVVGVLNYLRHYVSHQILSTNTLQFHQARTASLAQCYVGLQFLLREPLFALINSLQFVKQTAVIRPTLLVYGVIGYVTRLPQWLYQLGAAEPIAESKKAWDVQGYIERNLTYMPDDTLASQANSFVGAWPKSLFTDLCAQNMGLRFFIMAALAAWSNQTVSIDRLFKPILLDPQFQTRDMGPDVLSVREKWNTWKRIWMDPAKPQPLFFGSQRQAEMAFTQNGLWGIVYKLLVHVQVLFYTLLQCANEFLGLPFLALGALLIQTQGLYNIVAGLLFSEKQFNQGLTQKVSVYQTITNAISSVYVAQFIVMMGVFKQQIMLCSHLADFLLCNILLNGLHTLFRVALVATDATPVQDKKKRIEDTVKGGLSVFLWGPYKPEVSLAELGEPRSSLGPSL